MKRALVALVAGTVLTGLAAAYATTMRHAEPVEIAVDENAPQYVSPFEKDAKLERVAASR